MKTPRELLLERHRAVESKLDEVRKRALSQTLASESGEIAAPRRQLRRAGPGGVPANLWRELIWRPRLAWGGMAALWMVLWMVNRQIEPSAVAMISAQSRPTAEAVRAFEEQQRLLVELLQPTAAGPAEPARSRSEPRSELRTTLRAS